MAQTDSSSSNESTKGKGDLSTKIALKLLRVTGQTQTFYFSPNDSASDIAKHVFEHWPEDWTEETADSYDMLRLIYQGRFIHANATLGALKIPVGKTTVMHLICRKTMPEPNSPDQKGKEKSREGRCQMCCCIL